MYGVKFSLWLTGAVGPQAVTGRHSSTRPLAGSRLGAGIVSDTILTTTILAPNQLSIIICSLMLWIDLWCFF